MNRGIYYDQNVLDIIPGELWLPIPESLIPGINPYYYISTKGRVWSTALNNFRGGLLSPYLTNKGYVMISLSKKDRDYAKISIHRVEMILFNWIPGCENLEVNHIDGDKTNNDITNLEWVTRSENLYHAYNNGLRLKGEDNPLSTHTEDQVRKICEGLEKRHTLIQCAVLAGLEPNHTSEAFVSNIKHKKIWKSISDEYNIPKGSNHQLFDDDEVHQICKLMESGLNNDEIVKIVRPDLEKSKYKNVMTSIRNRRRLTRISDNYNF